jgi:Trypsin-like peptidase domain
VAGLIDRSIVRVFSNSAATRPGTPYGIGFLVGPQSVLTCAHVVQAATGKAALQPGDGVMIDFPMIAPGDLRRAAVTQISNDAAAADLAGLAVTSVPAPAAAVRVVAADGSEGHRVQAFGTTRARDAGVWSQGVLRRPIAGGVLQIEDERGYGVPIQPGFSGSPLIDQDLGAVIGMLTSVESKPDRRVAYALPGATLHAAWPLLADLGAQRSPFRSLEPFQQADAEHFFGRDSCAREVADRLDQDGRGLITGPSGSGKSSLVLAGVLPLLAGDGRDCVVFRAAAGSSCWQALAASLIDFLSPGPAALAEIDGLAARLRDGGAEDVLNRALVGRNLRRLTIVPDQLDEGLARDGDAARDLLAALLDVHGSHRREPRIDVLVTLSTDALDGLLSDQRLGHRLGGHVVTLAEPGPDELRSIVTGPLAAVGMPVYEPGLADVLLQEVAGERNPLPLLEFTLTLLWEQQDRGVLTHAAYRELGGVAGALAHYAERVCAGYLAADGTATELRWLLSQLISPVEPDRTVRRVVPLDQLGTSAGLARELAASRLVTLGTLAGQRDTVELAHEALIRHWPRLRGWVSQDRAFRAWQDDLDRQAARWYSQPDKARLLRGSVLRDTRLRAGQHPGALTQRQREFLAASIRYTRRRWSRVCLVAVLIVGLAATVAEVSWGLIRQRDTQNATTASQALLAQQQNLGVSRPMQDLALDVRAFRTYDDLGTRDPLHSWATELRYATAVLPGSYRYTGAVQPINASTSGMVLTNPAGQLVAWSLAGRRPAGVVIPARAGPGGQPVSVAWLGSGELITSYRGGPGIVWNSRTGRPVRRVPFGGDVLLTDPAGRLVGYGDSGQRVLRVADLADPQAAPRRIRLPGPLGAGPQSLPGQLIPMDLLPDGGLLVQTTTGQTELAGRGRLQILHIPGSAPGLQLAQAGGGRQPTAIGCVTTSTHTILQARALLTGRLLGQDSQYRGIGTENCNEALGTFTAGGRYVAVTDSSAAVTGGGTTTDAGPVGGPLRSFPTPPGYAAVQTTVEPGGTQRIVLWGMDSMLVLEVPPRTPMQAAEHRAELTVTAGRSLLVGFRDGRVGAWDTATQRETGTVAAVPPSQGDNLVLTADPSGHVLVTRDGSAGSVRLWRLPGLAPLGGLRLPAPPPGYSSIGVGVQFAGQRLIVTQWQVLGPAKTDEGKPGRAEVSVWDPRTWRQEFPPVTVRTPNVMANESSTVGFLVPSPSLTELVQDDNGQIRRILLPGGTVVPQSGFTDDDDTAAMSAPPVIDHSGRFLALAHQNVVEIWDLDSGHRVARLVTPQGSSVSAISFLGASVSLKVVLGETDGARDDLAEAWNWRPYWGIPAWFGSRLSTVTDLAGPGAGPGSLNPAAWLTAVCRTWYPNALDTSVAGLPASSWTGRVCPGR